MEVYDSIRSKHAILCYKTFPTSQKMTKIVTEFDKFRYNHLPMGIGVFGDIFQTKLDKLLGDIEGIKKYIENVLVLSKDWFRKHIEQLRIIFGGLHTSGLKFNAPKWSFGLKKSLYLGYFITRKGIKPEPKKLQ